MLQKILMIYALTFCGLITLQAEQNNFSPYSSEEEMEDSEQDENEDQHKEHLLSCKDCH